jgi:hypothetical protein
MDKTHFGYIKVYAVGASVQFSPHMDIWMRGAKTGRITSRKLAGEAWLYNVAPIFEGRELRIRVKAMADDLRPNW